MTENNDSREIRELSDEELGDVTGGGLKEIVAATTLATMMATGMTGAFGLAKAHAEAYSPAIEAPVEETTFSLAGDDSYAEAQTVESEAMTAEASYSWGYTVVVDTGTSSNAGVWKNWSDITGAKASYSLPNGTEVTLLGEPQYNKAKKRNYVEIEFTYKGKLRQGWIAASIVGLAR